MTSHIIQITIIALICLNALATVYYGGLPFNRGDTLNKANQLIQEQPQPQGWYLNQAPQQTTQQRVKPTKLSVSARIVLNQRENWLQNRLRLD